jgi:hypothetical protein
VGKNGFLRSIQQGFRTPTVQSSPNSKLHCSSLCRKGAPERYSSGVLEASMEQIPFKEILLLKEILG